MTQDVLAKETNRRQLQQIISGLSDGIILVEVDQTILWANEAALTMHGVDDVAALGSNAREYAERFALRYRNNHPLPLENYPLARAAAGDEFSDVVVEVMPTSDEEKTWVHRLRSLVISDSHGTPELLVLILSDATEWASAEQRFEKTFNANPAPAVICRLSDLRYIKVNQGFLEMTGYNRDQVIGRSVYELDVLEHAERRELAVQRLGEGATIPQMQAELKLPGGGSKLVIVAGQPLDMNEEDCMLFSFTDLEPRRKAEIALRQSEERFAKSFRLTPVPTLVCSAANRQVVDVNEAFMTITGYTSEELIRQIHRRHQLHRQPGGGRPVIRHPGESRQPRWPGPQGAQERQRGHRLRGLGGHGDHSGCALLPAGDDEHHRTQALGTGVGGGHRGSDAGRVLVQPDPDRETGQCQERQQPQPAERGLHRPDRP